MMTPTHIHLLLNHVPIFSLLLSLVTLLLNRFWKSQAINRFCLGMIVISALTVLPTYFTGDDTEEAVEHLPQVSESFIDKHEDSAKLSLILIEVTGLLSALTLTLDLKRKVAPQYMVILLMTFLLVASASVSYTGFLGGQIRHSEIRQ